MAVEPADPAQLCDLVHGAVLGAQCSGQRAAVGDVPRRVLPGPAMPAPAGRVPAFCDQPLTGQHPVSGCPHVGHGRSLDRLEQHIGIGVQRPTTALADLHCGETQPGLHRRAQPGRVFLLDKPQQLHYLLHPQIRRGAGLPVPGGQVRLEGVQELREQALQVHGARRVHRPRQVGDELGQRVGVAVRRTHVLVAVLQPGQVRQRPD
ncbi:hypothetical protein ACFRQM_43865 [Streptomyces sp. NPDC056831]|uniref:hypothetical protein n=1 Tax=Streptomyces sp. NPDC056831 TaxID=3345954 RepID=UPI00368B81E4